MKQSVVTLFVKNHLREIAVYLSVAFLHGVTTFLLPLFVGSFVDLYYRTGTGKARVLSLLHIKISTLDQFFLFFLSMIVLKAILSYFEKYRGVLLSDRFVEYINRVIFATQLNWSKDQVDNSSLGKRLMRFSGDMTTSRNLLLKGWLGLIKHGLLFLCGIGLLLLLHERLTVQLLLSVLALAPFFWWINNWQKKDMAQARKSKADLLAFVTDVFKMQHNATSAWEENESNSLQFDQQQKRVALASRRHHVKSGVLQAGISVAGYVVIGMLLLWIVYMPSGYMQAGEMLVYILILFRLFSSLRSLLRIPSVLQKGRVSVRKINKMVKNGTFKNKTAVSLSPGIMHSA